MFVQRRLLGGVLTALGFLGAVVGLPGSADAAASGDTVLFDGLERKPDPEATYEANAYTIIHIGRSNRVGEAGSWWRPARGLVYRIAVDPAAFFSVLGRPDLAAAAASRQSLAEVLVVSGYAASIAGVLLAPWGLYKGNVALAVGGVGLMVGGVVIRFVGEDRRKPALPEAEAIDFADRYNQALRAHLKIAPVGPSAGAPSSVPAKSPIAIAVVPLLFPNLVGAVATLHF